MMVSIIASILAITRAMVSYTEHGWASHALA